MRVGSRRKHVEGGRGGGALLGAGGTPTLPAAPPFVGAGKHCGQAPLLSGAALIGISPIGLYNLRLSRLACMVHHLSFIIYHLS